MPSAFAAEPPDLPEPLPPASGALFEILAPGEPPDPDPSPLADRSLGFCVPPNEALLDYWTRVEDRLFKIRHCMTIDGVKRAQAFWDPEIDPEVLVRARAAGIPLDELQTLLDRQPPAHRFEVLLERARRFSATAQQFGAQLLAALERKDERELAELRAVHETAILDLVDRHHAAAVATAEAELDHIAAQKAAVQVRIDHYTALLEIDGTDALDNAALRAVTGALGGDVSALNLSGTEARSLAAQVAAMESQAKAGEAEAKGNRIRELGPQWSAGLVGQTGGGLPEPVIARGFADVAARYGSANVDARFQRRAFRHRDRATGASASAGVLAAAARFALRKSERQMQLDMATAERDALDMRSSVADIRLTAARRQRETDRQRRRHAREVHDIARSRFTATGLYTHLSGTLAQLYRTAYDTAHRTARLAERAYRFETGDDASFVRPDNWTGSRAGLLAGERLHLQLQAMEAAFVDRDRRRQEVSLPCPLAEIDPDALLRLQETGTAAFRVPEWWHDLYYPGLYRRRIEAVRLSIQCVTGPYGNVAARLTLSDSAMRTGPDPAAALAGIQVARNSAVTASAAVSDPGVFTFDHADPRHLPFKGAGAIGDWTVALPARHPVFDYRSITDVVLELSVSADFDGALRMAVEGGTEGGPPGAVDAMLQAGMARLVSLAHEFPEAFFRLTDPGAGDPGPHRFPFDPARHLPAWAPLPRMRIADAELLLGPAQSLEIAALQGVTATLNGGATDTWSAPADRGGLPRASFGAFERALGDGPFDLEIGLDLPPEIALEDVLIRLSLFADPP